VRTFKNLWPKMVSLENLMGAAREAMKGKRRKVAGAKFFGDWEKECVDLREELMEARYRPGLYEYFKIYEPKERRVAAAPFRDRVLHHAVVRVLEPIFEKRFLEDSFACRKGKGTHAGMRRALNYAGKHPIALKCDIRKYFASIDHEILLKQLRRVVGDRRVLELCELIVGSHADGASRAWQGPMLFDVRERRRGLPVGNLTSQFFANIYLDGLDHFIKQELRVPGYVRYVDDFVLFGSTAKEVKEWGKRVAGYLAGLRLELHPDKVRVCRTRDGVDFCGFVVRADGRVKVRRASVRRFARRLKWMRWQMGRGEIRAERVTAGVRSWVAHVAHGQSWHLRAVVLAGKRGGCRRGVIEKTGRSEPGAARRLLELLQQQLGCLEPRPLQSVE